MRTRYILGTLAVAAVAAVGCEDITNPIEEFGEQTAPWVAFEAPRTVNGEQGSWVPVRYGGIAVRPEVDVNVTFGFGGTAAFGEDYVVVADSGSTEAQAGFDATGGVAMVDYDPFQESAVDTLWVYIPDSATAGSVVEISMTGASTVAGDSIGTGYEGDWADFDITVVATPADIPTGNYVGTVAGADIGGGPFDVAVEVTAPEGGVTVAGTTYEYLLSDFSLMMFGVPLAMPFNVYVDGSMEFAGQEQGLYSCGGAPITADISDAEYDLEAESFSFGVEWTSCGVEDSYTFTDLTYTQ